MAITSFNDLKNNSQSLLELTNKIDNMNNKFKSFNDDRFWQPTPDKAGNSAAVIRFLPPSMGEDTPFVKYFEHSFQDKNTKMWYIEKSLTTIGKPDPCTEYNRTLWNSGTEGQNQARKQKRNEKYISNILVISDPNNPDAEGKVFLFKYGPKIFGKIQEALQPKLEIDKPFNPFDFFKGANFKLVMTKNDVFVNYDSSSFYPVSPLSDNEEFIRNVWENQYKLNEFIDPSSFKTYEELKERLEAVCGLNEPEFMKTPDNKSTQTRIVEDSVPTSWETKDAPWLSVNKDKIDVTKVTETTQSVSGVNEDTLSFIKSLAERAKK